MSNLDNGEQMTSAVKIGVSACLLGRNVRFDGGHKRSRFITDSLAAHFELVPFCPEYGQSSERTERPVKNH